MGHPVAPRLVHRAAILLAAATLAACGAARKVAEDQPICSRCHGGASGNAAPPRALNGATETAFPGVGAHQAHLVAGRLRGPIPCGECHVVPADMQAHEAGIAAIASGAAKRVTFGTLADQGAGAAAYDATSATCSNTYCHGANLGHGGTKHAPAWNVVDAGHSEAACGTCHFQRGDPFPASHPTGNDDCFACHPATVNPDNVSINVAGGGHINGVVDGGCTTCHAAPPATGAHLAHASPSFAQYGDTGLTADHAGPTATRYAFGCGNCHPLDFAAHAVHTGATPSLVAIVELSPGGAAAGSLRARNDAGASYDPATKTCSGTYCHSSGQATPAPPRIVPAWNAPAGSLGCGGCHGNPPAYASGGAGTATANGHVGRFTDGANLVASGHFGGLPGALHQGSAHGGGIGTQLAGDSAAPITCQTCHYRTADPANTGPSGFYYLDTTGTYDQAGATGSAIVVSCAACHDGGALSPAQGLGRAVPFFHVNGTREVDFDPRTSLGALAGITLPAPPNAPTRPYWYTRATTDNLSGATSPVVSALPSLSGAGLDGTTFSLELSAASWDPAAKTCSSVGCHLNEAHRAPIRWGEPFGTCNVCHNK